LPLTVQLDVNDDISVKNAIQSITAESSRIDVLVNNAGYGLTGAFEDLSMEEIRSQYETNLFGVIRVTPIHSAYVSTKFAIEGLSESMSYELEPFGIKMVLVEPGFIKTKIANNMVTTKKSQDANSAYSQLTEKMVLNIEHGLETGSPPDVVAKVVLKAVTSENPTMRYLAGKDVEKWMEAKRRMSDEEFHKMMKQNMK